MEGLDGILDTSIDLGIEISEEIDGTVIIDSLELYVNPLNVPPVIGGILSLRVLFPGETEMFDLAGFAEVDYFFYCFFFFFQPVFFFFINLIFVLILSFFDYLLV